MNKISEEKIQDYIDGRLNEQDEATVAAFLLANPHQAAEVQEIRYHNEALQAVGTEILSEPAPDRLSGILKDAIDQENRNERSAERAVWRKRGVFEGAALAASLALGILIGWGSHSAFQSPPNISQLALQTARDAYLFYGGEKDYPVEFGADRDTDFANWVEKSFKRKINRPNLDDVGYRYVGARALPWARGRMGLYLYENAEGARAAFLFWPTDMPTSQPAAQVNFEDLRTSVYVKDGLEYAVICDKKNSDFDRISETALRYVKEPKN